MKTSKTKMKKDNFIKLSKLKITNNFIKNKINGGITKNIKTNNNISA
jgi:hypothetical protein